MSENIAEESHIKAWRRIESEQLADCRVFKVRRDMSVSPHGGDGKDFYVIEACDWINVVPVTANDEIVMIEQYRHGSNEITLEIPGGMIDADESPARAAIRELLEETGYFAHEVILLGRTRPNPAFQDNWLYTFLARDATYTGPPAFGEDEEIAVHLVSSFDIPALIANGTVTHALVIAALGLWSLYQENLIRVE